MKQKKTLRDTEIIYGTIKEVVKLQKNLVMDFRETRKQLEISADSLADPDSDKLKSRRLKRINLLKHDYFLLYRIDETDGIVYVTNMFHSREDYENKLR